MKKADEWGLVAFGVGLIFIGGYYGYQKLYLKARGYIARSVSSTDRPDYSGLTLNSVFFQDLKKGIGVAAVIGSEITIDFSLWIYDPKSPDNRSSNLIGEDKPIRTTFIIGESKSVFSGLESSLVGLSNKSKRILVVPPSAKKLLNIKNLPNDDQILMFEIETVSIK